MALKVLRHREWSEHDTRACYRVYSKIFVPLAVLVLIGLPISGREIIWNVDGLNQYYSFFLYEGQWIRGIFGNLFAGNGFQIPLWEWHSGYGADVPTTFDVFLDPFNLVSIVTPTSVSEWVFQLLVVLRLYLAGLGFVFYCRTRGENRTGTVLGALLYALCGAGLVVVRWTSGLHALILFPIILAGAERILAGRKPWVFVASLTMLCIASYYFTYMAVILLIGYLIVRVIMVERPNLTVGRFLRWVGVFAGLTILCALLACFALVPAAVALMGMDRFVDGSAAVPLLYGPSYYLQVLGSFLSITNVGSDTYQGFGGLAFLACVALFMRPRENRALKIVFIVLTVFFLLPCIGSLFNGFNYATNRWAWAYALCVAFILTRTTPALLALDARGKRILAISAAVYGLFLLIPAFRTEENVAGFAALLGALVLLLLVKGPETRRQLLTAALSLTLVVNGFYFLAASENGMSKEAVPLGMALAKLTSQSADSIALEANDDSWWRYDEGLVSRFAHAPMNRIGNNSLVLGLNGIDFYNSVYNSNVDAFHNELAVTGDSINFWYTSLQGRSDLMALLGVKYYGFRHDGTDSAPYGYPESNEVAQRVIAGVDYRLLRANASLPIAYAFDSAISKSDYLSLTPAQRQQALLQMVVLEDDQSQGEGAALASTSALSFEDASMPFTVEGSPGVVVEDGRFLVQDVNATVTITFQGTPQADTYLYFSGLALSGVKPSDYLSDEEKADMSWYKKADLLAKDLTYSAPTNYEMHIHSNVTPLEGIVYNDTPDFHMYGGKDTWLVNLGYSEEAAQSITISFNRAGEYRFDDLQVITETHTQQANWIADRSRSVMQDAELGCNRLSGSVDLDKAQTLLITTPYSNGWTAYVDGQPAELLRADTAFMGLALDAGHHDIELRYFTPGLAEGFMLTGVGVIALIAFIVVVRMRNPRRAETRDGGSKKEEADDLV